MVTCERRECALHARIGVQPPMLLVACKVLAAILHNLRVLGGLTLEIVKWAGTAITASFAFPPR